MVLEGQLQQGASQAWKPCIDHCTGGKAEQTDSAKPSYQCFFFFFTSSYPFTSQLLSFLTLFPVSNPLLPFKTPSLLYLTGQRSLLSGTEKWHQTFKAHFLLSLLTENKRVEPEWLWKSSPAFRAMHISGFFLLWWTQVALFKYLLWNNFLGSINIHCPSGKWDTVVVIEHFRSLRIEWETNWNIKLEDKPFGSGLVSTRNTEGQSQTLQMLDPFCGQVNSHQSRSACKHQNGERCSLCMEVDIAIIWRHR